LAILVMALRQREFDALGSNQGGASAEYQKLNIEDVT
jgi:hypothetical protein